MLKGMGATLISSEYKVIGFDWKNNKACVNKVDTYRKRNGKKCYVHHHFSMWIAIPDELIDVTEKEVTVESNDWYVSHRETITRTVKVKNVSDENQKVLVGLYHHQRTKTKGE